MSYVRPVGASYIPMEQGFFVCVLPGLPVQGTFRRHCSDLWPMHQSSVARQLEEVPKSGATAGTFLMTPPECRAVHPKKIFIISVTMSQLNLFHAAIFRNLLMSNQKLAVSDPHPFAKTLKSSGVITHPCCTPDLTVKQRLPSPSSHATASAPVRRSSSN
eukprot:304062-Chlamydomonas_euryale.AAC.3